MGNRTSRFRKVEWVASRIFQCCCGWWWNHCSFGDIDNTGYLDRLFVHTDYQGKGIATAICNQLEQAVKGDITTHASITAKPFFEKRGYKIVKEQQVERQGIFLTNYVMIKER